jgi:DNA-binding transcriptional MerR regulator
MTDELWTIEQLPDRVAELLSQDYEGQQNGRVRELPNGRTIRWYTTIGLVDRPISRGRTALYGPRHVLQLAAVKRLQAAGRTLAEIQQELVGVTDDRLAELAKVPSLDVVFPQQPIRVEPFWHRNATTDQADSVAHTVSKAVFGVRVDDSVTVMLEGADRAPTDAELAELEAAAAPLLAAIERLGLSPRKEQR